MEIVKASNCDANDVADLIFGIWVDELEFEVIRDDYPDLKDLEEYYHNKDGNFLVARINNEVVGTVACERINDSTYILKRMFVKNQYRGQGIAQALLDELMKDFSTGTSFFLSTNDALAHAAKNLYLRNGFERIGRESLPTGFPYFYEDDLFMRKIL